MMKVEKIEELAKIVLKFSPMIATALGCPYAGMIAQLLSSAFNVAPEDLAATIANDPTSSDKIKEFEIEHQDVLTKIGATDFQTEVDDRQSARSAELQREEFFKKRDWVLSSIAILVVVGFFMLCVLNYLFPIRDDHVLVMLIGQISSAFLMVLSYYFGGVKRAIY